MKADRIFFLLTLFLALILSSPALAQRILFNKVLPPEGRDFEHVTGIVQDKQGYMWFSSKKGLYRYDGYNMISYKNNPLNPNSLVSNSLESLCLDSSGILWIGAIGAGLDMFDPSTGLFTHYHHDANNPSSLSNDTVTVILQDHNLTIWIGTHGGLDTIDRKTGRFTHFRHRPNDPASISSNQVRALYEDRQGTLWIGTGSPWTGDGGGPEEGGLNRFDRMTGKFTSYRHIPGNPGSLVSNKVRAMFEDSKGNFWVGTGGDGLHMMDRAKGTFTHYLYDPLHPEKLSRPRIPEYAADIAHITFITEDAAGALWIGTADAGLNYFDTRSKKITHYEGEKDTAGMFTDNGTWAAFASREGVLWISSLAGNLYKIDPFKRDLPFVPLGTFVNAIHEVGETLWIPTGNGLLRINKGTTRRFLHDPLNPSSISSNYVRCVTNDRQGNIWVGTDNGLNLMDKQKETFTQYKHDVKNYASLLDNFVITIYQDHRSNLWIGTSLGLDLFNRKTGSFIHYRVTKDTNNTSSHITTSILEDRQGRLWVGLWVARGIHKLNRETGKFDNYLVGVSISSIFEDAEGTVWAGGDDGLYRYNNATGIFTRFIDPGLPTGLDNIISIAEDDQRNLWLSSANGIIRINQNRNESSVYSKNYQVEGTEFIMGSGYKSKEGKLYFGNTTGYFAFFPNQLFQNSIPPQIILTGFRIADQEVKPGLKSVLTEPVTELNKIKLSYDQNVFSFDFTAIDYINPQDNRHMYMLENYDKSWRPGGTERRAYYFNVPPGKYTFRVKAANSDGVWAEKSIEIVISPPWWQTWWAYLIFALLIIGAVWGFIYYRSRSLIKEKRVLEEKVKLRTAQVLEQKEEIAAQRDNLADALSELKSTQSQLLQREKMASLGELTAGIAHEIQNPLNFVNNFSEVNRELVDEMEEALRRDNKEEAISIASNIKGNLEKINHHGQRADAIVKGMLQHSRINTGQKEPTDLNALADEYLRLSYHGLRAKDKTFNATMQTDFDQTIGKINIVPQDIGRVLLNLYNNAFYAVTEKKKKLGDTYEPTVSVTTKKVNDQIEVRVKDNGMGIPQKVLDKIFQPFFTTKPTGQGTGLGLSLAYDIVTKEHGGQLKVETKEGEGSEFIIQLPTD